MPALEKQDKLPQKSHCKPRHDQTHHNDVADPSRLSVIPGLIYWLGCHLQMTLSATKQLMPDPCRLAMGCSLPCNRSAVALIAITVILILTHRPSKPTFKLVRTSQYSKTSFKGYRDRGLIDMTVLLSDVHLSQSVLLQDKLRISKEK